MANKKCKKLEEMQQEEIEDKASDPKWSVKYKNYEFIAYENSFYDARPILSCYIFRDNTFVEHSGRSRYFSKEKALEELKWKYKAYLKDDVIKLLMEKGKTKIVPPDDYTEPYFEIKLFADDVSKEQWDKVRELFDKYD